MTGQIQSGKAVLRRCGFILTLSGGVWLIRKRRLMAHLGAFWSLARYRSAPQTNAMATQLQNSGQLELLTGRVVHISAAADPGRLSAHLASGETLPADRIVNCTGMGRDPLLADMLTTGVVRADAFGRGPWLGDDLRLCTPSGQLLPVSLRSGRSDRRQRR